VNVRSINPRTGQLIREFSPSSNAEVQDALARCRRVQKEWFSETSAEDRIAAVKELEAVCRRRIDEVVGVMHEEVGIPKKALAASYNSALAGVDHYVSEYRRMVDIDYPLPSTWTETKASVMFYPHGVIGHIGVWNFPFWQTMITAFPALLAGNGIVFKPSELCTMSGLRIADLVNEAGFPNHLYSAVVGGGEVGKLMVASDFDAVAFTGSYETGLDITRHAGIKPLILELSGNDAAIVREDADIEQAARGIAYGTFSRGGQVCIRIKRVYVNERVAEELIHRLVGIASKLNIEEDVGPLIREEARERVARVVQDAIKGGAELLCGGSKVKEPGFYYQPTVLRYSNDGLEVVSKETFGPVCPVRVVHDDEQAINLANSSPYGLGATIWTKDMEKGWELAKRLEAGNIWINECVRTLPCGEYFQGWKQSAIPSSMSRLQMFTKKKTVVAHSSCQPRAHWFQ
jgi:acyl-CoA reductase-like NAD-dependent aldehyde dehydrogenase